MAHATLETVVSHAPIAFRDGKVFSKIAYQVLTFPEERFRDISLAMEAAQRGTELSPGVGWNWLALGIAQYRSGAWAEARESLLKFVKLDPDTEHLPTSCFLAMANWQLGEKDTARRHYDDALQSIEKHKTQDNILLGFHDEAAELLGIDPKVQDDKYNKNN